MKPLFRLSFRAAVIVGALLSSSCALYPRRATYELANSYSSARTQLIGHHQGLQRKMTIFQDGRSTLNRENGKRTELIQLTHAPEVFYPIVMYRAVLEPQGQGSHLQIVTGTAQGSGFLTDIDRWVSSSLKVKSRVIDEDQSVAPRSIWY